MTEYLTCYQRPLGELVEQNYMVTQNFLIKHGAIPINKTHHQRIVLIHPLYVFCIISDIFSSRVPSSSETIIHPQHGETLRAWCFLHVLTMRYSVNSYDHWLQIHVLTMRYSVNSYDHWLQIHVLTMRCSINSYDHWLQLHVLTMRCSVNSYDHWLHLTPYSKVLPEKLTGPQLVKKFHALYGIRKFITAFITARHLSLSWKRLIQSMPPILLLEDPF
jgi:hypothetical protein